MPRILTPQTQYNWDEMRLAVALGNIDGWEIYRKFGMNPGVTSGTEEMWPIGTPKVWPTTAAVASVTSDSASDDGDPAGTGGWALQIYGLDENFLEVDETITLNGTSAVVTTQTFIRINRAVVLTAGSNGINVGNISITVGGDLQAYIEAGEGQTHQTHLTVPANKIFIITTYNIGVGRMSGSTDIHVLGQIRLNGGENDEAWRSISDIYLWNGGRHSNDQGATVLPAKADARQVIESTASTQAFSVISGYLVELGSF